MIEVASCFNCGVITRGHGTRRSEHPIEQINQGKPFLPGWYHTTTSWGGGGKKTNYNKKCAMCSCKKPAPIGGKKE